VLVCALGDALLDVVVRPGRALVEGDDVPAEIRVSAGGQAANVAAWAVELGARGRVIAKRADDTTAALVEAELRSRGVDVAGPVVSGRSGIVVSQVGPGGERSLQSDRGVCAELRAEEIEVAWFQGCAVLHLSGYALLARPIDEAGAKAAGAVAVQGGRVSVDLAAWTAIEAFGPERLLGRLEDLDPDVVFASEREMEVLGGEPPASTLVVKRAAQGCTVVKGGKSIDYEAAAADVVDTTGAGDAFAAGFLIGGPELALEAAARCVSRLGAMP
jgi:sugar/nucleoside kinase (ribokinase family)